MTAVHLRVFDDELLSRSKSGAIWGRIYFDVGSESFPEKGWSDLVAVITTAWLETLKTMSEGATAETKVFFMDGPAQVRISSAQPRMVKLEFIHKETIKHSLMTNLDSLLQDGIRAGQALITICQRHGWADGEDYSHLIDGVNRGIEALPV